MRIAEKTREQLTGELGALRLRIAELEELKAERKRVEGGLGQSIEQFQTLLEEAPIGICNTDLKGKITYINKRFEEVSGYSRQELVGKNGFKLGMFSAEALKLLAKRLIERLRGSPPRLLEVQFRCKDGHWIWIAMEGKIMKEKGVPVGFQIISRNITERKQAEEELQAEKNKLQSVIDALEDGLSIQDRDYNIIYQNEQLINIIGNHLGEKCYRAYEGKDKVCDGCPMKKAFKDGKSHTSERRVVMPSGKIDFLENTANPIRDARGEIVSCLEITRNITERKQAEETLQAEKNKLTSVIDAMEDGLTIQDRDYNIIYQNELVRKLFGERPGEKCYQVYEGKEKLCDGCPVEKAFNDGKSHTSERRVVLPSGEVTFWENTANPIRDAEGKIVSCLEITRNITERKQAEQVLRENEAKYKTIFENVSDVIVRLDKRGKIIDANKRIEDHFGYKPDEIVGKNFIKLGVLSPKDLPKIVKFFREGVKGKSFPMMELEVKRKDGSTAHLEANTTLVKKNGKIEGTVAIIRDITERKRAEEALQQNREELRTMFESVTDGISVIDLNGVITEVNQRTVEMHGFSSKEELVGKSALELVAPCDHERVAINMRKALTQGIIRGVEYTLLKADGSEFPGELSTSVLKDASGKAIGHITIARDITERRQMEQELKLKAQFLDSATDAIFVHDADDNFIYANEAACRTHGYSRKEFMKMKLPQLVAPERDRLLASDRQELLDKGHIVTESAHLRKDGSIMPVEVHARTIESDGRKQFLIVARDITERKRAEELYRTLANSSPIGVYILQEGKFKFVNPQFQKYTGFSEDELLDKESLETVHLEDRERVRKNAVDMLKGKRLSPYELRYIVKSGEILWATETVTSIQYQGKRAVLGNFMDVTERKQAEEALRESQKFSSGLLENSPNPIFVVNPDTSVKYANPAFEKLTGFTVAEITGRKAPYPWWPKKQWKETTASFKNAMVTGGERSERVFQKKNGERFFVVINSAPVIHRGKLLYFLVSWLDITERKRAEEEREDLEQKAHLASRLASVGEMASGIAHEINNPLTAVIGFAQLLMDTDLPDEVQEDIGVIHKEAQRAAGVARNLLTFARKHTPTKQPTNLNSIIEGVLKLRAYEQSVSNIKVNTRFALNLPEVMADYSQMQQVFINIILNAETAMLDTGNGGTLTITTQKVNNLVRASFADSGPGIAKENLNRIFDPFFTTKEVGKGTGLGLSVCHGIVAEHGGRIYARSKLGKGATFIVDLPTNAR